MDNMNLDNADGRENRKPKVPQYDATPRKKNQEYEGKKVFAKCVNGEFRICVQDGKPILVDDYVLFFEDDLQIIEPYILYKDDVPQEIEILLEEVQKVLDENEQLKKDLDAVTKELDKFRRGRPRRFTDVEEGEIYMQHTIDGKSLRVLAKEHAASLETIRKAVNKYK